MHCTIALVTLALLAADPLGPGDHNRTVAVGELTRSYTVHVPRGHDPKKPTPVVLVFHGAGSNARQTIRLTGLSDKADAAGFLAVYPEGTGRFATWNAGNCCGNARRNAVDDVAFVRAILDELAGVANVDAKRVFATGISNGAMLSYRLASELSDRIAAIAPVSGTMGSETCDPKRPVSVMHFHGTADDFVPYDGGRAEKSLPTIRFLSVDHSIRAWVKADNCPDKPVVVELPNRAADGILVTRSTYGPGDDGAEVILYAIKGGGHTWPGHELPFGFLGKATKDISATDLMWDFFEKHPLK